ncbi:glutamate--cysteine ligase [Streptomyces sp. A3M-1-3]|uniref:carboxylate-amine ligase n=1 Tax=Streptomyces sp. A3M-1-3 TaxID=2962044 RepID=UPI0020B8090E|nr:glutamate--cysteine ligase [Streptomyces sp. A3M-1-3]MCP3820014.1 glutamate--cysteine ligase [Streptomyces sp. A3M-1-3]
MTAVEPYTREGLRPEPEPQPGPGSVPTTVAGGEILVPTMGVEEEFLLVDSRSRAPVARAAQVIEAASRVLGDQVQAEFYRAQVEVCTLPTTSCADLRGQLAGLRAIAAQAAREADSLLIASGTAVVPPPEPLPVTDTSRYRRMAALCGALVDGSGGVTCGCHVHIGTADRAQALLLANHLRPWLPVLQALVVNSPFSGGHDTGYGSWRSVEFGRWPTAEPPPLLDAAGYEETAEALVSSGILLDRRMIYWFARPSEHVPTLEVRVADVNADLDTTVLYAALVRGLAATLLAEARGGGGPPPDIPVTRLHAAHWHAARYGTEGPCLDALTGRHVPVHELVNALVERATPGLVAAGDLELVRELLARRRRIGSGADRQRAVYRRRGGLRDVVDHLAAATSAA